MTELHPQLREALAEHREATADAGVGIDVRADVAAAISKRPRRSIRWGAIPALAVVAALILWLSLRDRAVWVTASGALSADGRSLAADARVRLPSRFVSATGGGGHVIASGVDFNLWPDAELTLRDQTHASGLHGGVTITCEQPITITTPHGSITGRGIFDVETRHKGSPMTLTRNHKIGGALAIAVAVTAGWIVFRDNAGNETRVDEPGTAGIDSSGKVTALGPRALANAESGARGVATTGSSGSEADAPPVSGAFWDESEERIVFALAGEVLDAATGESIKAFDLSAQPIKSQGFGQRGSVRRSFSGKDGGFVLNNLGLGTWRVEVRADGYAPSVQVTELGDLYANPLLLFPLTRGAQITGQVLDWKGRGVSGSRVAEPDCLGAAQRAGCAIAESDEDGNFVLPAVPEARAFALRAEHKKYGFAELKNLVQSEGSTQHVVIRLSGILRISGSVTRGRDAAPVAGAVVATPGAAAATAETSVTGRYELLAPLEAHPKAFVVSDPSRPKARAKIASYPNRRSARELRWVEADTHVAEVEIDFQLQMEKASIVGSVRDIEGKPMAGLELDFGNSAGWKRGRRHQTFPTAARTDANGRYRLDDVPFGAGYRVSYREPDDPREGSGTLLGFVSVSNEEEVVANFTIGGGTIRGEFVDASGARFAASSRGCMRLGATQADGIHYLPHCYPDGRFEFTKLPPGTYKLENRLPKQNSPIEITATTADIKAGEVLEGVVVEAAGEPSVMWKIRVLTEDGRFVPGAYVRYRKGDTMFTSNLGVGPNGVAEFSISRSFETIHIDAAGYQSVEIALVGKDPSQVISVRMARKSGE